MFGRKGTGFSIESVTRLNATFWNTAAEVAHLVPTVTAAAEKTVEGKSRDISGDLQKRLLEL